MANPFVGEIKIVGFNFPPKGWVMCAGQLLPINQYTAVFSLLGTFYGGNGQNNFGLPDLQGRLAIGQGNGPGLSPAVIGQFGGAENVTLLYNNLPMHNHEITGNVSVATTVSTINRLGDSPLPNGHILGLSVTNVTPPTVVKAYSDQASDGGALGGVSSALTSTLATALS